MVYCDFCLFRGPFTFTISPVMKRLDGRFSISDIRRVEHASPDIFDGDGRLDEPQTAGGHRVYAGGEQGSDAVA